MLRAGHVLDELLDTVYTLAWTAVPCQRRCITIELWQVVCSGGRVIGGVVQTGKLICGSRRYVYADPNVNNDWMNWLDVLVAGER